MKKLLIIAADQERLGSPAGPHTLKLVHEDILKKAGGDTCKVIIATPERAEKHFADAEIIAAFPMRVPPIERVPRAKWLHSFSAGVDKILTPAVVSSDVLVTNSSGIHATPIAEHIIAYMLMFTRGFLKTVHNQQSHLWKKDGALGEVRGSHVLIVGLGEIGRETARLAKSFGASVSAVSRSGTDKPAFVDRLEKSDELDALLPIADFVVITLPHTSETHYLLNREKIRKMKKTAVLINIGRGGIVEENDLVDALHADEIAGAALDVFEIEPLPTESKLWDMEQVIITPHHSGLSRKYMDRAIELFCKNLDAYLKGDPSTPLRARQLPNLVDKKLGY